MARKVSGLSKNGPKVAKLYSVAVGIGEKIKKEILRQIAGENGSVIAIERFDQLA